MRAPIPLLSCVLACAGLLLPLATAAEPPIAELRAAAAGPVLDAPVVDALEESGRVRIIAAFSGEPGPRLSDRANAARARLIGEGYYPGRRYTRLPVLAGSVDAKALAALLADPDLLRVSLDGQTRAQLGEAVPLVNLDDLHAAGHVGNGATVAVIDTGVDLVHPDLAGSVVDEYCFCDDGMPGISGCCPNGQDEDGGAGAGQDDHGHGTRVGSIYTSAAVHAPLGGAPDAQLVSVKVLSASGSGFATDLLAGLDWVLATHPEAVVANMSLGFGLYDGDCDGVDALTMSFASAVDQLRAAGVLTVAGAGNNGSGAGMIVPACIANAVSVGAVWDSDVGSQTRFGCTDATTEADQVACWSNSSATTDLFAPGGRMTSSRLGGTTSSPAGTSYSAPIAGACAAVLAKAHPMATPAEIEAALEQSPVLVEDDTNGLSFPRVDCEAAHALLSPPPAVPSFGRSGLLSVPALALAGLGGWALWRRQQQGAGGPMGRSSGR